MEISVECTGQSLPDKNKYIVVINEEMVDDKKRSWESCYRMVESRIKKDEREKDLSDIKRILQEKGFVKVRDKGYGIGIILPDV